MEYGPLFPHSCEISRLLSKWKEISSPTLSRAGRLHTTLWAPCIISHILCYSHLLMLCTPPDSPLSKPRVCSDHDTLLLKTLPWLPIASRTKERLISLIVKDLCHLAFIISTQVEPLSIVHACPLLSCFYTFTSLLLWPESPFSSLLLPSLTLHLELWPWTNY